LRVASIVGILIIICALLCRRCLFCCSSSGYISLFFLPLFFCTCFAGRLQFSASQLLGHILNSLTIVFGFFEREKIGKLVCRGVSGGVCSFFFFLACLGAISLILGICSLESRSVVCCSSPLQRKDSVATVRRVFLENKRS
jgi:hypothetical protein